MSRNNCRERGVGTEAHGHVTEGEARAVRLRFPLDGGDKAAAEAGRPPCGHQRAVSAITSVTPSPPPRPAGHRRGRVSAEAPLLPGARGGLRELTTWVRTQARAPPAHTATSLETEQLWPHYGRTEGQPLPRPRPGLSGAPPPTKPPRGADGASRSFPTTFQNTGATKSQPGNSSLPIGLKIPTASVR